MRRIGIFWMEDEKGPDAKIICVPLGDRAGNGYGTSVAAATPV